MVQKNYFQIFIYSPKFLETSAKSFLPCIIAESYKSLLPSGGGECIYTSEPLIENTYAIGEETNPCSRIKRPKRHLFLLTRQGTILVRYSNRVIPINTANRSREYSHFVIGINLKIARDACLYNMMLCLTLYANFASNNEILPSHVHCKCH